MVEELNLPKPLIEAFNKIEALERTDLKNTIVNTKGQKGRIKTTRAAMAKSYAILDTLLPKSIACVEKIMFDEMRKGQKRDGYLILSIAKFLASRRLPEVGKTDPMKEDEFRVELTIPRPMKSIPKIENPLQDMTNMRSGDIRFKSEYPVDMLIRTAEGEIVKDIVDITEDGVIDMREEIGTFGFAKEEEVEANE